MNIFFMQMNIGNFITDSLEYRTSVYIEMNLNLEEVVKDQNLIHSIKWHTILSPHYVFKITAINFFLDCDSSTYIPIVL